MSPARVDDRRRLDLAMTALAALRIGEREVLALCVWSGLDYREAAEALGVPIGTVRSRLSRARKKLAELVAAGILRPLDKRAAPERHLEPPSSHGQVRGDREIAVRSAQEITR